MTIDRLKRGQVALMLKWTDTQAMSQLTIATTIKTIRIIIVDKDIMVEIMGGIAAAATTVAIKVMMDAHILISIKTLIGTRERRCIQVLSKAVLLV